MIPGVLDYAKLAQVHRPIEPSKLAAEIRRLHRQGLTANDISIALRLDYADVVNLLAGAAP